MTELEWQTLKKPNDARLRNLQPAWKTQPYRGRMDATRLHSAVLTEYPTANCFVENTLFVRGRLLGVIEAKKVTVNGEAPIPVSARRGRCFGMANSTNE